MQKKIVFMGTPEYARVILEALYNEPVFKIQATFTMPDKKVGRKGLLTPPPVKTFAVQNKISVYQVLKLTKQEAKIIQDLKPDFIVVAAFGLLLPKSVLEIAPCVNLHASILPKYRGASPIEACIVNNDEYFGLTAMLMNEELDTGDMLSFSMVKNEGQNASELTEILSKRGGELAVGTLKNFQDLLPQKQISCNCCYAKKITKEQRIVEFKNAWEIYRKFLAFGKSRGLYLSNGIKLTDLEFIDCKESFDYPKILKIEKRSVYVGCLIGKIKINFLIPPSKKEMDAASFVRGKRLKVGDPIF